VPYTKLEWGGTYVSISSFVKNEIRVIKKLELGCTPASISSFVKKYVSYIKLELG
jgi:hypothetical protein